MSHFVKKLFCFDKNINTYDALGIGLNEDVVQISWFLSETLWLDNRSFWFITAFTVTILPRELKRQNSFVFQILHCSGIAALSLDLWIAWHFRITYRWFCSIGIFFVEGVVVHRSCYKLFPKRLFSRMVRHSVCLQFSKHEIIVPVMARKGSMLNVLAKLFHSSNH